MVGVQRDHEAQGLGHPNAGRQPAGQDRGRRQGRRVANRRLFERLGKEQTNRRTHPAGRRSPAVAHLRDQVLPPQGRTRQRGQGQGSTRAARVGHSEQQHRTHVGGAGRTARPARSLERAVQDLDPD
uniref:(northern house mosquito) hypothetical protein n=1 Tax=Culex pipiens TaxID=7175 RepID=A0A8D8C798_CULPI